MHRAALALVPIAVPRISVYLDGAEATLVYWTHDLLRGRALIRAEPPCPGAVALERARNLQAMTGQDVVLIEGARELLLDDQSRHH